MNKPLVSITVPVYNAKMFLEHTLESLANQTLTNIEILLVDDGSTDGSGVICDRMAQLDSRFKVFHKENGGSASARQVGLDNSSGLYYTVCDSDDWVESEMYEELYNKALAEDADIVLSDFYSNYSNGEQKISKPYKFVNQEQYLEDLMQGKASGITCSKLIRTDVFKKYDVNYVPGINLGEDGMLLYKLLLHPLKIVQLNKAFYHYRRISGSSSYTNSINMKTFKQAEYVSEWRRKTFNAAKYDRINLQNVIGLVFIAIRTSDMDIEYFKSNVINQVHINDILKKRIFTFKSLLCIIAKIFGYKSAKQLYNISYRYLYR